MDLKLIKSKDIKALQKELQELKKDNAEIKEEWFNTKQAAEYLKVCSKTLENYRVAGKLAFSKDGRMIRYKKSDLIKYLEGKYFSIDEINKNKA